MPDSTDRKIEELYKMVRSNNKMLRSMRRQAFWGMLFKLVLYAILFGVPVYLYFTIFQPILANLMDSYAQIQQTGAQIQATSGQLTEVTNAIPFERLQGLLNHIPGVDFAGTSQ